MYESHLDIARENFLELAKNPYPGRGIVTGLDRTGEYLVQVYWIMGRSENSRNRVFEEVYDELGKLRTAPADPAKMKDPSLVIYNAMRQRGRHYIVSNGDQTDTVAQYREGPLYLNAALAGREYEPDAPNFTQRITAVTSLSKGRPLTQMSILRKSSFGKGCDRLVHEYGPSPGLGWYISTYAGDGNPLPPFRGDPLLMPIEGRVRDVAHFYWAALNEDNRVSLAVKFVEMANGHSDIYIINKYQQI